MEQKFYGVVYRYKNALKNDPEFGRSYVGATDKEKTRIKCWRNKGNNYAGKALADARKRTGWKNWEYEVLEKVKASSQKELNSKLTERETYWIKHYDSFNNGYNSNIGGTGLKGAKCSKESLKQRSATRKKNGFCHTQATKEKLRAKNLNKKHTPETCKKISDKLKNKPKSEKHKKNLSSALKGRVITPEARAKSSKTKTGKPHTISPKGKANIDANRYKIPVTVTYPDGSIKTFPTQKSAGEYIGYKAISYYIETGHKTANGLLIQYKDGTKNQPKKKKK